MRVRDAVFVGTVLSRETWRNLYEPEWSRGRSNHFSITARRCSAQKAARLYVLEHRETTSKKVQAVLFQWWKSFCLCLAKREPRNKWKKSLINCLNPTELRGPELFAGHCCPCLQLQFSSPVSSGLTAAEVLFLGRGWVMTCLKGLLVFQYDWLMMEEWEMSFHKTKAISQIW